MKDNKERKKLIKNVLDRGKCKDNNKNKHQKFKIISTVLVVLFITLFTCWYYY